MSKLDDLILSAEDVAHEKHLIKQLFLELIAETDPNKKPATPTSIYWGHELRRKVDAL